MTPQRFCMLRFLLRSGLVIALAVAAVVVARVGIRAARSSGLVRTVSASDAGPSLPPANSPAPSIATSRGATDSGPPLRASVSATTAAAVTTAPAPASATTPASEAAPVTIDGAESFVFRALEPEPLRVHVFKPAGWKQGDRRAAFVVFFGGNWTNGTPLQVASWTRWIASLGVVGVAPDYRTASRFGTTPLEAVADARAAIRWLEDHAAELGLDPARIVVGGNSAGGLLALWTAISAAPPGSPAAESPRIKPAALVLTSAVTDTSPAGGYTPERFGANALALSPVHQLDARMPPVLLVHGDADRIVPFVHATRLRDAWRGRGVCELVTVKGGTHAFGSEMPEWRDKLRAHIEQFFRRQHVLP